MKYPCLCCSYLTISELSAYEVCPVCFWEDDGLYSPFTGPYTTNDPSAANEGLTLTQAKANYAEFGACDRNMLPYVRKPLPKEIP